MARYYNTIRADGKVGYTPMMIGSVWVPGEERRPAMAVWVTGPESAGPVAQTIRAGRTWEPLGNTSRQDVGDRKIHWLKTNRPHLTQTTSPTGDVITTAYWPQQFSLRPRVQADEFNFVCLPREDQMTSTDPAIADHAMHHVGKIHNITPHRYGGSWDVNDPIKRWFKSYADVTATYLAGRVTSPVLLGFIPRVLLFATLLRGYHAKWEYRGQHARYSSYAQRFACPGMRDLGHAWGLYVATTAEIISDTMPRICQYVVQTWGVDALTSETVSNMDV
jgi:hypothetical protein